LFELLVFGVELDEVLFPGSPGPPANGIIWKIPGKCLLAGLARMANGIILAAPVIC
jgi:hypothetical protein